MNNDLINNICKCLNIREFRELLVEKDYAAAIEIILSMLDDKAVLMDNPMAVFDDLYEALENNDLIWLENICLDAEEIYELDAIYQILMFYNNDLNIEEPLLNVTDSSEIEAFFEALTYINNLEDRETINLTHFANQLCKLKNKKYAQIKELDRVLNLPLVWDENSTDPRIQYVEALIYGLQIDYGDVVKAFMNEDPDMLMKKIAMLSYLRKFYGFLLTPQRDELISQIGAIDIMSLKRDPLKKD